MEYPIITENKLKYIETGTDKDEVLLLLHGLFGAMSNFREVIQHFSRKMNVVVPLLPIFEMPLRKVSVGGLVEYVSKFVQHKGYRKVHALGNSLGGHIALLYALRIPEKIKSITLTGSSGLFENAMGSSFPKRGDYNFVKTRTESVFFNPKVATKQLVDEVFQIVNNRGMAIRLVAMAKSAVRQNLGDKLHQIMAPALLVWGNQDTITPPFVAEKFDELIPNTKLVFVDQCGHAPMMEQPAVFNKILEEFLQDIRQYDAQPVSF